LYQLAHFVSSRHSTCCTQTAVADAQDGLGGYFLWICADAVVRAIICGKPEMRIGEIDIMATLKSELPPATLWSTERWR
jgi:hypothetical protein